jgi:hypothetical protein
LALRSEGPPSAQKGALAVLNSSMGLPGSFHHSIDCLIVIHRLG